MAEARRIASVEAARGVAAAYVVLSHVLQVLGYHAGKPGTPVLAVLFGGYAHNAVLFFFLLSGFSIHYASATRPLGDWAGVRHYFYLRLRRLYPILLIGFAVALSLLAIGVWLGLPGYAEMLASITPSQLLLNVLLVADLNYQCGRWAAVLPNFGTAWSLSYELAYYALYPLFWRVAQRYSTQAAVGAGAALSLLALVIGPIACDHVWNVLSLYFLWCLGAWVADMRRRNAHVAVPRQLLWIAITGLLVLVPAIGSTRFAIATDIGWGIMFALILLLPLSRPANWAIGLRGLAALAAILPTLVALTATLLQLWGPKTAAGIVQMAVFALAGALLVVRNRHPLLGRLTRIGIRLAVPVGMISYALYLMHYPILHFAYSLAPVHTAAGVAPWLAVALLLTVVFSYWLERRFQPFAAHRLDAWCAAWLPARVRDA